jgi:hypothetical protein
MKLATIEKITKLSPHPNAERLELVQVLGYQGVVPIGLHKEGDLVVYIQPDTVLPKDEEWAEEYIRYSPKRVKAVKLRGEWSEGVVMPLKKFLLMGYKFGLISIRPNDNTIYPSITKDGWRIIDEITLEIGLEVSEMIGVIKYEPPLPANESAIGVLPYGLGKTDEERFENMLEKIPYGAIVDVTLKVDGQSTTHGFYIADDRYLLTGRRFEINADEENRYSIHVPKVKDKIIGYCKKHNLSLAFRGESYGNGIQGCEINSHSRLPHSLAIFSIYNLEERRYERKGSPHYFVNVCDELGIERVPVLEENVVLTEELIKKYSTGITKLPNGNYFEGVVINHATGSFKIINKYYDANK